MKQQIVQMTNGMDAGITSSNFFVFLDGGGNLS